MLLLSSIMKHKVAGLYFLSTATLLMTAIMFFAPSAHAVQNNTAGIPNDPVLSQMQAWGQTTNPNTSTGRHCSTVFRNAQFHWVSPSDDTRLRTVNLSNGQTIASLRYNTLGATCDSAINSSGVIFDRNLRITRFHVVNVSTSYGSVSNSISGTYRDISYQSAQDNNRRYTNIAGVNFALSGLGGLAPGRHTVYVTVRARLINRFANGAHACVRNQEPAANLNDTRCPTQDTVVPITIVVPSGDNNAECSVFSWSAMPGFPTGSVSHPVAVADTNNTPLTTPVRIDAPGPTGTRLHVGIRFTNTGTTTWRSDPDLGRYGATMTGDKTALEEVEMSNATTMSPATGNSFPTENIPPDASNPEWRRRVYSRSENVNTPRGEAALYWFAITIPSSYTSGQVSLRWIMAQFNDVGTRTRERFGKQCGLTINIGVNRNLPYIHAAGSDVISGARFGSRALGRNSCRSTVDAARARIQTNGYYDIDGADRLYGSSMSQYAVFASGVIGDDNNYGVNNNFLGNFSYMRPEINTSSGAKDVLFAHIGAVEPNEHGNFYSKTENPPLPCVDIRSLQDEATPTATPLSFIDGNESGVRSYAGNLQIPARTIAANGAKKTLIVDGTVTIQGNINQQQVYSDIGSIPSLTIIARNVHIEAGAQNVDASLIAIPSPGANATSQTEGILDTCSNFGGTPAGSWFSGATINGCNREPSLVINGQVVARRILWKRTGGTIGTRQMTISGCYFANYTDVGDTPLIPFGGTPTDVSNATVARSEKCAAEVVKLPAEKYITNFERESQDSNIPISTIELPPIY